MVCSTLIKIGLDAAIDLLFEKSEVFGQLLVQPALNTNILGAEDGAVCTITALKLLLNWDVLESMNFFQKN